MNKKTQILTILTIFAIMIVGFFLVNQAPRRVRDVDRVSENLPATLPAVPDGSNSAGPTASKQITIVPTMLDEVTSNSSWCGTFQLVWNDMKNEIVGQDVVFSPQEKMAANLNQEQFTAQMLSDDHYFKIYGLKSLELKDRIEAGIKQKFNQTSDILADFDWSDSALDDPSNDEVKRYFLYAMLYRKFEFLKSFDVLADGQFANKYQDVKYFGVDADTNDAVGKQIEVLYYNSPDDFAVLVNTKSDDEVIFYKNPQGTTFQEIYASLLARANSYQGNIFFGDGDEFKAPKLVFNQKRDYTELEGKRFKTADPDYDEGEIEKAIQSIKFSLDENGGEIKSEAGLDMMVRATSLAPEPDAPRYFYVDDTFAIFLRQKGEELPYFAARVDDITQFQ